MSQPGSAANPLRVAIIGAGPTGFYAAEHLFKKDVVVEVDMFDRLPTPFGLVRGGVAPDHQKIKSVTLVFDRIAKRPNFRFYGYVELGRDLTVADLRAHYHQLIYTTGAQTDRPLGIPGQDLNGSHTATEFVAWYNGHPDYRELEFDLSQERVAVVGVGNVAVDVCRILCRTVAELAKTDIADYALEALSHSRVKEVVMVGRRGPAQAAFTNPEIKELGEMEDADIKVLPEEAELDPLSRDMLERDQDRNTMKKVEILQEYAGWSRTSCMPPTPVHCGPGPPINLKIYPSACSFARLATGGCRCRACLSTINGASSSTNEAASSIPTRSSPCRANIPPVGSNGDPAASSAPTNRMRPRP
jgi:ferredoxin--NADP+ reductase